MAIVANVMTGANYEYLCRAPDDPSILDALGPWATVRRKIFSDDDAENRDGHEQESHFLLNDNRQGPSP